MTTPRERTPARITLTVIGMVLLTGLALLLVYETRRVLTWIVIAAFFATALHPLASWFERRVPWIRRGLSTLLVFLLVFLVLAGLVAVFVVPLVNQGTQFVNDLPRIIHDTQAGRGPLGGLINRFHLRDYVAAHGAQLREFLTRLGAPTLGFLRGTATTVAGILTIFVLSYLMVLQGPRIVDGVLDVLAPRWGKRVRRVGRECARMITGYITGNLLISLICGVLTYVVLAVMRVPFAGLLALFVAFADLMPLIGATLGAVVATLAAFLHSLTAGIVVLVFFIVYQQIENHVLQPLIMARTVRLDPLTVVISILIGVELAGLLGALLAIPVAGVLQVVVRDVWRERRVRHAADRPPPDGGKAEPPPVGAGAEPPPGEGVTPRRTG
ncbi:AI-2E family transporter [Planosporangium flavigriseum]|uniref:AI-2E family transporter n=1 Tax=Planosporangium flavigriseum TaxID=373681 RepID=A0A8J3PPT2_9ACTN|nr:AI-2E family transporter [Planosporangium flavigriseum]NJC63360.1 AI-2E family transporter [Planosporangium flavigriseum]GIG75341.1 AI-2E family transporter [Planosporangium flavigriseum]